MSTTRFLTIMLCVLLGACNRTSERTASAPEAEANAQSEAAAKDTNLVRIDPAMLRDLRITTQAVESRAGAEEVTLLGELSVDQRAYAEIATPVTARVTRLLAGIGDDVRVGTPLVELSSPDLGKARADYLSATAQVQLTEATLQRKRELAAERIVPQREVQESEADAAGAHAARRSALAALGAFGVPPPESDKEIAGSTFVLRSPVRGTVIDRTAMVGQMLEPSTAAFLVGDLTTLWLTVHAFERDAVRLAAGARTRVGFSALPGRKFEGTVALIGRQVERESRTIPIRIDVPNSGTLLRPGMSATANVPVGASGAPILSVPVASVQRVRDQWCVFIPKDDSTFEIRTIGRGRDLGGEVEVLSGLRAGDRVVVDGAFLLKAQAERGGADHDDH